MNITTTQTEKDAWFAHIKTLNHSREIIQADGSTVSKVTFEPYFPQSLNFLPVKSPCFMVNDKVHSVETRRFKDESELETYLDNTPNIGLYYAGRSTEASSFFVARIAHIDTDHLSPLTIEEFYEKHKDVLHEANAECGTLEGLKSQMQKVNGLGMIQYLTKFIAGVGQPISIRIKNLITDGSFVYLKR
jgi:hypothetical protein